MERTKFLDIHGGGSHGFLETEMLGSTPDGEWKEFIDILINKLYSYNISLLDKDYVSRDLPFEANIPTISTQGNYKIFDALFYWED